MASQPTEVTTCVATVADDTGSTGDEIVVECDHVSDNTGLTIGRCIVRLIAPLKRGPGGLHADAQKWTPEETRQLVRLVREIGTKWKCIGRLMGRNQVSTRHHYYRFCMGDVDKQLGIAKNRCRKCGQLRRGHICRPTEPAA